MRGPQLLPPAKSSAVYATRLLSWIFFQPESNASLPSPSPPSVPVTNSGSPYEQYSTAVHQLHPLFPPDCPSLEVDDANIVSDIPLEAGGYADIFEVTLNGRSVIQKTYRRYEKGDFESIFRRYCRDVSACSQLSHPNVVPFVGITSPPPRPFSLIFDTAGHLGLKEYLKKNPQADKWNLVRGIACGLKHVHDLDIIHGRLCFQNILVGPDGTPRITGFGSSLMISRPDLWSDKDVAGFHRGSAPELMRPSKPGKPAAKITKESDMYAFGMLTWEIFSGQDPFPGDLDATVVVRVLKGDRPPRPDARIGFPNPVWKVVKSCWRDSPSRRMAVWEVLALLDAE